MDIEKLVERLLARIEELEKTIEVLKVENKRLKAEHGELKERLGLNSKNSGIPSSKELYQMKRERPKSGRKPGGQPGHKGAVWARREADEVVAVGINPMCACGGGIYINPNPYIHQKVELPEIKPIVTEYQLAHGRCRKCGKRQSAQLPEGVTSDIFGSRAKAVIGTLSGFYKNSRRDVEQIFKEVFNFKISLGSVSNNERRISQRCESSYKEIQELVKASPVLHIDETGHSTQGKKGWCWMFASQQGSFLKLHVSRGQKVLAEVMPTLPKVVITDRYPAYNYFPSTSRQFCWAHIARDFERFAHSYHPKIKKIGTQLKALSSELFALSRAFHQGLLSQDFFRRRARKLRKRTLYFLKQIFLVPEAKKAWGTAKNILKSEEKLWKFIEDPSAIPLTNNFAERQIRHFVAHRKKALFTWSQRGNHFLEHIISLFLTCRQRGLSPFKSLLALA